MLIVLKVVGKTDGHNLFQILLYYFFKAKKAAAKRFFSLDGRCAHYFAPLASFFGLSLAGCTSLTIIALSIKSACNFLAFR